MAERRPFTFGETVGFVMGDPIRLSVGADLLKSPRRFHVRRLIESARRRLEETGVRFSESEIFREYYKESQFHREDGEFIGTLIHFDELGIVTIRPKSILLTKQGRLVLEEVLQPWGTYPLER